MLEPTRAENVLDIVLTSQKEFVDNVYICEPLGCSDHNQIYFIIKVKGEQNRKIQYMKENHKGRYKCTRKYFAKEYRNNILKNKTTAECSNVLKSKIDCIVDKFVPLKKNRGNGLKRNTERSH